MLSAATCRRRIGCIHGRAGTLLAAGCRWMGHPARVGVLSDGVLKGMLLTRLCWALAVLLAVGSWLASGCRPAAAFRRRDDLAGERQATGTDDARAERPVSTGTAIRCPLTRWLGRASAGGTRHGLGRSPSPPDGKRVASGASTGRHASGMCPPAKNCTAGWTICMVISSGGGVLSISFAPDGKSLAVARLNGRSLFSGSWQKHEARRPIGSQKIGPPGCVRLRTASTSPVWTVAGACTLPMSPVREQVRRLEVPGARALHGAFAPDGRTLACGL